MPRCPSFAREFQRPNLGDAGRESCMRPERHFCHAPHLAMDRAVGDTFQPLSCNATVAPSGSSPLLSSSWPSRPHLRLHEVSQPESPEPWAAPGEGWYFLADVGRPLDGQEAGNMTVGSSTVTTISPGRVADAIAGGKKYAALMARHGAKSVRMMLLMSSTPIRLVSSCCAAMICWPARWTSVSVTP